MSRIHLASRITETNKILTAVQRRLPEDISNKSRIDWVNLYSGLGYCLKIDYFFSKTESKWVEIVFWGEYGNVYTKVIEAVCYPDQQYHVEKKEFPVTEFIKDRNESYDKAVKTAFRKAVSNIIDISKSYFESNSTQFIQKL